MQLPITKIAAVLAGIATVQAAPALADSSANAGNHVLKALKSRQVNDCGPATFENQSSGGSPRIEDCRQITRNIAGGGNWVVSSVGFHTLATSGTCAFGVDTIEPYDAKVGNLDIIDLINDSIGKFSWNGLVGAKGEMQCQSTTIGWVKLAWALYHT